ncbi:hypothetical protein ORI89_15405 [Sphingobacterium sp. UT-1RO-CII-1]|nr:hypothetical protein [Sphingobacterium sp. UT-1RO-CII-1]MCY4781046.1 hypothetical protein [Sphingobacterium sp. UT-1RO-CII-1]
MKNNYDQSIGNITTANRKQNLQNSWRTGLLDRDLADMYRVEV